MRVVAYTLATRVLRAYNMRESQLRLDLSSKVRGNELSLAPLPLFVSSVVAETDYPWQTLIIT